MSFSAWAAKLISQNFISMSAQNPDPKTHLSPTAFTLFQISLTLVVTATIYIYIILFSKSFSHV